MKILVMKLIMPEEILLNSSIVVSAPTQAPFDTSFAILSVGYSSKFRANPWGGGSGNVRNIESQ